MSSTGLQISPLLLFCFIYLFITYSTFFPFSFPHFAHVDVFVCLLTIPDRISSLMACVSSSCADYHIPPPSKLLASTQAGITLLRTYHNPNSPLYKLCSGKVGFLFGLLTLADGTDRLSPDVSKKLSLLV